MSALVFKVYDEDGVMQGSTRDATFAACLVTHLQGGKVKYQGRIIYKQNGQDGRGDGDAGESFDSAAETMLQRIDDHCMEQVRRRERAAQLPRGRNVDLARSSNRSVS